MRNFLWWLKKRGAIGFLIMLSAFVIMYKVIPGEHDKWLWFAALLYLIGALLASFSSL